MLSDHEPRSSREELVRVIRQVRNRWRLKIALRGSAIMVTAGVIAFLLSAYGLEYFRFSAPAIIAFRLLTYVGLTGLLIWSLVLPLARRVTDERVALYLEEHEPSLQAALVSALEESGKPNALERADMSPALIRQLIMVAVEKCRTVDSGRGVERQSLQRSSVVLAGLAAAALALFLFGPGYLRHGLSALAFPTSSVEAASPYKIVVAPGDATIARGADQVVTAQLDGFQAEDVELYSRADANVPFEPLPLVPSLDGDAYEVMLFDVAEPTEYFVQSSGIRSPVYTLEVVDVPFVGRLELEYHFPAYTGLPPRTIENGGDVAALRGTEVRVRAVPTMGTPAGQLVMDEETVLSLAREADGSFTTSFTIDADGFFRIDLEDPNGTMVTASAQYTIDVLDDQPPVVGFGKPGRDTTASPVEEIFVEAKADDDFGVRSLELVYSVNGGEEEVLSLLDDPDSALHNVAAGHTFFLEEFELEPGDFISYYARANDSTEGATDADAGNLGTSDLYFVQIRPFGKNFMPEESQGGGGGGGGGAQEPNALSQQQREIISATFNIVRDRDDYTDDEFRENVVFLALAQGKLREQVQTLLSRLNSRVANVDPAFVKISEILPQAAESMQAAEETLQTQNVEDALPPEQHALQMLQRAEEAYEDVRVSMGQQGGGGGGGGGAAVDRRGSGRPLRTGTGQAAESVRDDAARAAADGRHAARRDPRAAEGTRTSPGAGSRAAAAALERPAHGLVGRRRQSARARRRDGRSRPPPRAAGPRGIRSRHDADGAAAAGSRRRDAARRREPGQPGHDRRRCRPRAVARGAAPARTGTVGPARAGHRRGARPGRRPGRRRA